ncbi:MAG TPA: hypothetical protein VME86_13650 [Acidobacteriaceae bacterium]|nr:hypothetical protein [Acidobacteriaceae bacterium]
MQRNFRTLLLFALFCWLNVAAAHAGRIALLLEEPYGHFGSLNPTGHAAIYLSDVCSETPVRLRRCYPGETGVVISRYNHVGGYDWIAMPLLAYLYAVDDPNQIPSQVNEKMVERMQDAYRRQHLLKIVPNGPDGGMAHGDWTQLLGEAYIRKIYGFSLETTPQQDDALIAALNDHSNRRRFNLLFDNCANFAEKILNFYYPHSIHRNFITDVGIMTPKQAAHSLDRYARHHSDLDLTTFVIPQVQGTIHRSTPVHGVLESLLETKKYAVPLALLDPPVAGGLVAVYIGDGRFHPGAHMESIFNPHKDAEPGVHLAKESSPDLPRAAGPVLKQVSYQYPHRGYSSPYASESDVPHGNDTLTPQKHAPSPSE